MEFLSVSHNTFLVLMSCLIALVAGFTGLSLTRSLASKPMFEKKASIALASVALGGGIWAMHFVAMLGLQMPILFYYDAAITLVSALTAILIVGAALILLHFVERTPLTIALAGGIVGLGILTMHYIGMAGLELCRAVYTPFGVVLSSFVAIVLCVLAFGVAYGQRTNRHILLGTLCFAAAVTAVHFLAMLGTEFVAVPSGPEFGPLMSNETLALGVIVFSFIMFGACLWVSVTYLPGPETPAANTSDATANSAEPSDPIKTPPTPNAPLASAQSSKPPAGQAAPHTQTVIATNDSLPFLQIPCERDGGKVFIAARDVLFVRADGHYTQVYTEQDRLFCAWSVTEAAKRLLPEGFLQTHRSYLVNPQHVARFERTKDKGTCLFDAEGVPPAPVSRSKLKATQDALAAQVGALRAD
ncbi:LytTR family transcriptional regulator DNA-binding domain-containing protein [Phaeobacter sp. CNT1-3]|nr:LytTR family transcriptional regulator DNA-binding domain-containing protein [Phaeobacter sp. CNT1-3]